MHPKHKNTVVENDEHGGSYKDWLDWYETMLIEDSLAKCGGNATKAAKLIGMGQSTIQATILELLPSEETVENRLYLEKIDFRDQIGLNSLVDFTEPGQSEYLFQQINTHQQFLKKETRKDVQLQEAGADWYSTIYLPLKTLIQNSGLLQSFPDRTIDDLYLRHHFPALVPVHNGDVTHLGTIIPGRIMLDHVIIRIIIIHIHTNIDPVGWTIIRVGNPP